MITMDDPMIIICFLLHGACLCEDATFTRHAQLPVAQFAPPLQHSVAHSAVAHVHVHDPVVPPTVPCVESQTIVPAVLPSPAVHALAAKSQGITSTMAGMPPVE